MRRLLAPLTRWLDQRIDARIAAASSARFQEALHRLDASRDRRSTFAGAANDAVGASPAGHAGLVEMVATGVSDAATVQREDR